MRYLFAKKRNAMNERKRISHQKEEADECSDFGDHRITVVNSTHTPHPDRYPFVPKVATRLLKTTQGTRTWREWNTTSSASMFSSAYMVWYSVLYAVRYVPPRNLWIYSLSPWQGVFSLLETTSSTRTAAVKECEVRTVRINEGWNPTFSDLHASIHTLHHLGRKCVLNWIRRRKSLRQLAVLLVAGTLG